MDKPLVFEVGKFYRHRAGICDASIIGELDTTLYGRSLVAEVSDSHQLQAFGFGPDAAENWYEITEKDWLANFNSLPEEVSA